MIWSSAQTDAKDKGYLVFAMSQRQTAVQKQPGPWGSAFDGYCIGLATNWISLAYHGKNFPISEQTCENPPWESTKAQSLADAAAGGPSGFTGTWRVAAQTFDLRISTALQFTQALGPQAHFLWSALSKAYGCYGVTLSRTESAHAIVLRHSHGDTYHLFDPNYYHVRLTGEARFRNFLHAHLKNSGYATRYTHTEVIGIKPPLGASVG